MEDLTLHDDTGGGFDIFGTIFIICEFAGFDLIDVFCIVEDFVLYGLETFQRSGACFVPELAHPW